jgi:hypothetical protein
VAFDWTAAERNTLSAASAQLLQNMPHRIRVRAFISDSEQLREATRQMLRRYQREHDNVPCASNSSIHNANRAKRSGLAFATKARW